MLNYWKMSVRKNPVMGSIIKEVESIHISAWLNGASGPEALSVLTSTYNVEVRNFDDAADEDVYVVWQVPFDFYGLTIKFRVITWITIATGPVNEGVAFFLQGASIGDGKLLSSAHGTAIKSSWVAGSHAQYDRVATLWSGDITIPGIIAGETCVLKLYRDVSDTDDDYAQDIGVETIQLKYDRMITNV